MRNDASKIDILLAEDEPLDAELTISSLKRLQMAEHLKVVEDGAEALDFLFARGRYADRNAANRPKMILLDLKLPKVHGLEVLTQVKADPRTKDIPVVVLTGSQEERDIMQSMKLGVLAYIVKPFNTDKFINALASRKIPGITT